jgi:hypothetical protein
VRLEVQVERAVRVVLGGGAGRVDGQRGLAYPGHALDDADLRAVAGLLDEQAEFLVTADELHHLRGQRVRLRGPAQLPARPGEPGGQVRVLAEDALVQFGQHRPGLGAQLLDDLAPGVPVQAERLTGPAAAVQRGHLMRDERLVQRVLREQVAQLTDQVSVPAEFEFALDPLQDGGPALLFQAGPHPGHPVAADPGEWLAPPQPVRLAQQ